MTAHIRGQPQGWGTYRDDLVRGTVHHLEKLQHETGGDAAGLLLRGGWADLAALPGGGARGGHSSFLFRRESFLLVGFYHPPLGRALKKAPGAEWKETAGQALTSSLRMSTTNGSDKLTSLPVGRWLMVRRLNVTYELVVSTLVKGVCILSILLESTREYAS